MFVYYNVCYFTGILYAVVRQISMLFKDNKYSVFCVKQTFGLFLEFNELLIT